MASKNHKTLSQVMAILALIGILLSVVGTAWLSQQPIPQNVSIDSMISGEQVVNPQSDPVAQE